MTHTMTRKQASSLMINAFGALGVSLCLFAGGCGYRAPAEGVILYQGGRINQASDAIARRVEDERRINFYQQQAAGYYYHNPRPYYPTGGYVTERNSQYFIINTSIYSR